MQTDHSNHDAEHSKCSWRKKISLNTEQKTFLIVVYLTTILRVKFLHPVVKFPSIKVKLKETVHQNMEIRSSFTHPCVIPNLYAFLLQNTKEDILRNVHC